MSNKLLSYVQVSVSAYLVHIICLGYVDEFCDYFTVIVPLMCACLSMCSLCTGPISLCLDSCLCLCFCVYLVILHMCCIIVTRWGGPGGIEANP